MVLIEALLGGDGDEITMADETKTTIYQKIVNVMAAVNGVAKNGHNSFHNYDYTTEADVLEAIRGALIEQQIVILPATTSVTIGQDGVTTVMMNFMIVDAESGEFFTREWAGSGQDISTSGKLGDKGLYKAYTGAEKYFLMKTFLIPTNDDPERDDKPAARTGRNLEQTLETVGKIENKAQAYGADDFAREVSSKGESVADALERKTRVPGPSADEMAMATVVDEEADKEPKGEAVCFTCGLPATFRNGVSAKTGKAWRAYFCSSDDKSHVRWV